MSLLFCLLFWLGLQSTHAIIFDEDPNIEEDAKLNTVS